MKMWSLVLCGALVAAVMISSSGCQEAGGSPAAGLNANGFWAGKTRDGSICAANLVQKGADISGDGEVKIVRLGHLAGTLSGYRMKFTMAYLDGGKENGEGEFDKDGMKFTGRLPSVGDFYFLWRGPSFARHSDLNEPLSYSK